MTLGLVCPELLRLNVSWLFDVGLVAKRIKHLPLPSQWHTFPDLAAVGSASLLSVAEPSFFSFRAMSCSDESLEEVHDFVPELCKQFKIQTVSPRPCQRTGLPWPPADIYLWQNGQMGVGPLDRHGSWSMGGDPHVLRLTYNYRGWAVGPLSTTKYLPIEGARAWLVAPAHLQPEGFVPNMSVLIPVSSEGTVSVVPVPPYKRPRAEW